MELKKFALPQKIWSAKTRRRKRSAKRRRRTKRRRTRWKWRVTLQPMRRNASKTAIWSLPVDSIIHQWPLHLRRITQVRVAIRSRQVLICTLWTLPCYFQAEAQRPLSPGPLINICDSLLHTSAICPVLPCIYMRFICFANWNDFFKDENQTMHFLSFCLFNWVVGNILNLFSL